MHSNKPRGDAHYGEQGNEPMAEEEGRLLPFPIPLDFGRYQNAEFVELARGIEPPTCGLQRPTEAKLVDDVIPPESAGSSDQLAS